MYSQVDVWLSKLYNKQFDDPISDCSSHKYQFTFSFKRLSKYFVSSTLKILDRPSSNGNKSSTHPYFLKCIKTLETEDLLISNCLAIVLHDKPSRVLSTINQRR